MGFPRFAEAALRDVRESPHRWVSLRSGFSSELLRLSIRADALFGRILILRPNVRDDSAVAMNPETLTDLLVEELQDIYDAEQQLTKALPQMAQAAFDEELRDAFEQHLDVTKGQINRLEKVFEALKVPAKGKHCPAMAGLIEEAKELLASKGEGDPMVRDAGLIIAAQKVEHYEIASYGSARTLARTLGVENAAQLLQETLDEEAEADRLLTELAESSINADAADAEDEAIEEAQEDATSQDQTAR
jgi:ferritin-like metal-binding protein YciE